MHHIHITEGIVLGKRDVGEANTLVSIFTKELGLIRAAARSTRVEKSKLRYGLEPLTHARFSFVRGKRDWRLVGAEHAMHSAVGPTLLRRQAAGRISKLVTRLVQGEEPVPALFISLSEGLVFLANAANDQDAQAIETVLVLRILAQLGYLPHTPELTPFISDQLFSIELAAAAAQSRALLIKAINESLQQSGL
jgi:DNA repair protein RecO (recombination protein O)